jgi:type IV pilus assembly protein PilB
VLSILPAAKAHELEAIPLFLIGNELTVVLSRPDDLTRLDTLGFITGRRILPVFALTGDIRHHLASCYGETISALDSEMIEFETSTPEANEGELAIDGNNEEGEDRPIVRLVNLILASAITEGATDVHLEPQDGFMAVRLRIDGLLRPKPYQIPHSAQAAVISRIKILARIDISEKRIPQDGKVRISFQGRKIDIRVSTFPSVRGEKLVLRLLDKEKTNFQLDNIGMGDRLRREWVRLLGSSEGILLVTGPTGSGKSSTLFASLKHLSRPEINIVTLEDPVEYELAGVTQGQVQASSGFSFALGLRAILRQDPDVILVGEIRDLETAQIAVQAALTGHLVLATLHTNDAPSAVTRLVDLGVKPYLLASALRGVLAQRLVRRACPHCLIEAPLRADEEEILAPWLARGIEFHEGTGCRHCSDIGYRGRVGIYELLAVTPKLRSLIGGGAADEAIAAAAPESYVRLWDDGLAKIAERTTTLRELARIVEPIEIVPPKAGTE